MATIIEIGAPLREQFLSSNVYRQSRPYLSSSLPIYPTISDFISLGNNYPQGFVNTTDPDDNIYSIGANQLSEVIRLRVATENLDETVASSSAVFSALRGQVTTLNISDYKITRNVRNITTFERLSGANIDVTPFDERDFFLRGSQAVDDKYFEFTGNLNRTLHLNSVRQNYFSIRDAVVRDERFTPSNRLSTYYLNKRLQLRSSYFSSYIYLGSSAESVKRSVEAVKDLVHQTNFGIGSVVAQGFSSDDLAVDGEFGETQRAKLAAGNCLLSGNYINTTHQRNNGVDDNNPSTNIVWGATSLTEIEFRFGAKRGLLNYTGQMVRDFRVGGRVMDMTKKCYNRRGEIVFKGAPCRSWTFEDFYGKNKDTLIRGFGNNTENSVAKDYVHPKIHPTSGNNKNGGNIDNTNMMFSFENLAYTKQDLVENNIPECEWGPRYGRLLWFPPYIKDYTEQIIANYNKDTFVGRSEKLHTYSHTDRTFSLSFMIIMDYPFWFDKVTPDEMARLFSCELDTDQILRVPDYGETVQTSSRDDVVEPEPIELPPEVDIVSINDEIKFGDGKRIEYYFDNDLYAIPNISYEYYIDPTASRPDNLFGLNSAFYNTDPNNPIFQNIPSSTFPDMNLIDATGSKLEIYKNIFTENTSTDKPVRDFYNIRFIGNASSLFIGAQTKPSTYNRYLSYRRAFSVAKFFAGRYGISETSLTLSDSLTDSEFFKSNSGLRNSTLNDYNPDNMYPPRFPQKKSDYVFSNIDISLVFVEQKSDGTEGITFTIVAEGSSKSNIAVNDENKNTRDAKTSRNVLINSVVIQDKVKEYDDEQREIAEQERLEEISRREAARIPPPPPRDVFEIRSTEDDDINCTDRFSSTDPKYQGSDSSNQPAIDNYGFRKYRKFAPAFHSQTPEDFHRRLTFLNQLMYTGKAFSEATARNSVFGRAPLTIMRIGDFTHTKVVINDIGFNFQLGDSNFDLNPEGMGVQPMVCTVTMNGAIIGGQSLKGPIERLQNAISFNHYGNSTYYKTGIYANAVESETIQSEIDRNRKDRIDKEANITINGI